MTKDFFHISVLKAETIDCVFPTKSYLENLIKNGEKTFVFVDCTLGGAGHSLAFLEKFSQEKYLDLINLHLIGFDRDKNALAHSAQNLEKAKEKYKGFSFELVNDNFSSLESYFQQREGQIKIHGLIADLGVSSPHLDHAERGFSLKNPGPVDMRMDQSQDLHAKFILENYSEAGLTKIFFDYGEEPKARKLAHAIVTDRKIGKIPLENTVELGEYIRRVLGYHNSRVHPATRAFQALRIEVNQELSSLEQLLGGIPKHIAPGGKVGIISFHSLEDRIIKHTMRLWQKGKEGGKDNFETIKKAQNFQFPFNLDMGECFGKEIPRGGIVPSEEECAHNARARSSRLRCFIFADDYRYK